jgi:hypothetical protein
VQFTLHQEGPPGAIKGRQIRPDCGLIVVRFLPCCGPAQLMQIGAVGLPKPWKDGGIARLVAVGRKASAAGEAAKVQNPHLGSPHIRPVPYYSGAEDIAGGVVGGQDR